MMCGLFGSSNFAGASGSHEYLGCSGVCFTGSTIDASAEPVAVFVGFAVVVVGAAGVVVGALVACLVGSCGGGVVVHAANTRTISNTVTNRIVRSAQE